MHERESATKRRGTFTAKRLREAVLAAGAVAAKVIDPSSVETGQWVRWKCRFGCSCCGSSLVCPPHSPAPDQTRAMLDEYSRGVLFESAACDTKQIAVAVERELFLAGHYKALGLGAGPCMLCDACAFDEGCRHADEARPAMEACGIDVFATVRKHGFTLEVVRDAKEQQRYFGLVLVD